MSKNAGPGYEVTREVHAHCLCLQAQRAARALARRFDQAFRPLGLTNKQFSLLMSLNRPEAPGLGAVAAVLAMDRTTLTAALKPLERRGLVRIAPDAGDRRNRRLVLAPAGRALLAEAVPIWRRVHREIDDALGATDALRDGLRALSAPGGSRRAP